MIHLMVILFLWLIGYLIKYKKFSWLIAGYNTASKNEKQQYDESALCAAVGNLMFLSGGLCVVGIIREILDLFWLILTCWLLVTVAIVGGVVYLNTGNRFKKGE